MNNWLSKGMPKNMSPLLRFGLFVATSTALLLLYQAVLANITDANRELEVFKTFRLTLHYVVPGFLVLALSFLFQLWRRNVPTILKGLVVASLFVLPLLAAVMTIFLACAVYRICF